MHVYLEDKWSSRLCKFPETGMGYVRVDVLLCNGRCVKDVLVFNTKILEWPNNYPIRSDDISDIAPSGRKQRDFSSERTKGTT